VPEAAEMLGLSRNFTYELVKQKQIPVVKFGKRLLIPRVALEKMLEKGITQ
jgi:excisionase family DNA binding protein